MWTAFFDKKLLKQEIEGYKTDINKKRGEKTEQLEGLEKQLATLKLENKKLINEFHEQEKQNRKRRK